MLNKRDDGAKMVYSEDITRIDVGDTITWVPTSKGHNVEFIAVPKGFDKPKKSKASKEVQVTFTEPGIYYYLCTPHKSMGMIALVVVGGDQKVVMEPGDTITVESDTASSADVVLSHLDIT